jgi:hypothetical protein
VDASAVIVAVHVQHGDQVVSQQSSSFHGHGDGAVMMSEVLEATTAASTAELL